MKIAVRHSSDFYETKTLCRQARFSQFSNLLNHMESFGPKLSSNIRPNRDQLDEIQKLRDRLKPALATIESHVEHLLKKATPTVKERNLANRI
ncbi:hypothetical protein PENVUL_c117G03450 [Penicillium vulpinum]|uniref:Uncharacterized protein n=1 Tax=Penicillium vulpinum TaxID=29845 RepID=A0A1V6R2A2_9EURO|nr:hypothetical protein PENVUL_c117G03450 [Penicillium vulpinum]